MKYILLFLNLLNFSFAQEDFSHLQWYQNNRGEEIDYRNSFHDIVKRKTKKNFDLQIDKFYQKKPELKRDILVAVIDSGVNFDHPDLQHAIFKNKKECDEFGKIKFQVDQDLDRNGYPGDCSGWNFVSLTDAEIKKLLAQPRFKNLKPAAKLNFEKELKQLRRQPFDTDGHGTHVAGLLAAKRGNNYGIEGISNRIKILPIKVFESTNSLTNKFVQVISGSMVQKKPLSTIMIQAINYAIRMRVDVINMSLGWNKFSMTKKLEEVIMEAIKRNITIVTSADNGGSNDSTYPCRIPGVICVGGTDPFGNVSSISNYGHHVDILAPGEHMLSLFPVDDDPLEFPVAGYEFMSGTSQAAPLISGAVALLKMMQPRIGPLDLKRKLLNATDPIASPYEVDASLSGSVNFSKLNLEGGIEVFPNFKRTREFVYNVRSKSILGAISFENLARDEVKSKIVIESLDKIHPYRIEQEVNFKPYSLQDIKLSIPIQFLSKTSAFLKLKILVDDKAYRVDYPVSTFLNFNQLKKKKISARDFQKIKQMVTESLTPVIREQNDPYLYYSTTMVKEKGLRIHLFEENEHQFYAKRSFFLDKPTNETIFRQSRITSVIYRDLNYDGKKDFLIFSLHTEENKKDRSKSELYWQYTYLDENLKPLFTKKSEFKYLPPRSTFPNKFQTDIEDLIFTIPRKIEDLDFIPQTVSGLGKIAVPVFFQANSFVPYYQQAKDSFERIDVKATDQIFYLKIEYKDDDFYLVTYSALTKEFIKQLTGLRINLKAVEVIGPIRDGSSCGSVEQVCFYLVHGNSYYRSVSLLKLKPDFKYDILDMNSGAMIGKFKQGQSFTFGKPNYFGSRWLIAREGEQELFYQFAGHLLKEQMFDLDGLNLTDLANFETDDKNVRVSLSGNYLYRFSDSSDGVEKFKWKNYSFLSLSEQIDLYEPLFVKNQEEFYPGILWDAQFLTENSLRLAYFKEKEVVFPLKFSFKLPPTCQKLGSRFNQISSVYEIPLVCTTKDQKEASWFVIDLAQ